MTEKEILERYAELVTYRAHLHKLLDQNRKNIKEMSNETPRK